jgi:hypothetical protein
MVLPAALYAVPPLFDPVRVILAQLKSRPVVAAAGVIGRRRGCTARPAGAARTAECDHLRYQNPGDGTPRTFTSTLDGAAQMPFMFALTRL